LTVDHQGTNLPRSIQSSIDNSISFDEFLFFQYLLQMKNRTLISCKKDVERRPKAYRWCWD
jgi:hypothetical protein